MKFKLTTLKTLISNHSFSVDKKVISRKSFRDRRNVEPIKRFFKYSCQYCGYRLRSTSGKYICHFAHIIPHSVSRDNRLENVLILCPKHHTEFDYNEKKKKLILNTIKEKFPHIQYPDYKDLENQKLE